MHIFSSLFTQILLTLVGTTGDWFVAVVLITCCIKLLLFPLSVIQQRSQLLTANLNQAKSILNSKFRNKTEKVNAALMKIAAQYKVNPFSPFLTLLIQAPILFSLYSAVMNLSISAGSILVPWVASIHTADSLHILPVVAGLLQGLGGFTAEQRNWLLLILPFVIGVVFLWQMPAALSAYWIVNSALRYVEVKFFALNPVRRRLFKIPSAEEMVKGA